MPFSYDGLENEAVTLLSSLIDSADVIAIPENEKDYKRSLEKPLITVAYGGSDFMPTNSTNEVSQNEMVSLVFNIRSMNLRGTTGVYSILALLKKFLLGRKFAHLDRLMLKDIQFEQRDPTVNFWSYTLTLSGKKLQVQADPDDINVTYPLLKQVTLRDKLIETQY